MLCAQLAQRDGFIGDGILSLCLLRLNGFALRRDRSTIGRESICVRYAGQSGRAGQSGVLFGTTHSFGLETFPSGDLRFQVLYTIATIFGDCSFDFIALMALIAFLVIERSNPLAKPAQVQFQALATPFQQPGLHAGKKGAQRIPAAAHGDYLLHECGVMIAVGDQRREARDLRFRLQNRFVRTVQIVEMSHQCVDPRLHRKRFEHVLAHEIGEISHRLH